MKVIDATDLILGRAAAQIAKTAMDGEEMAVLNAENAVILGNRSSIVKEYLKRAKLGTRYQGPFFPKMPDRILKRAIRGMLPYKKETGKLALKRVKIYVGTPEEFKDKPAETIEGAKVDRNETRNFIKLGELAKSLGAHWDG
jgi:large subunit ribosomal protein L13